MDPRLAGLDARDIVTARHPWLHAAPGAAQLAALPDTPALQRPKPRTWAQVLGAVPPEVAAAESADSGDSWDFARRMRDAAFAPDGERQPAEIAGVDASARVPNGRQPMAGETDGGREVRDGRPSFFGSLMPPPTGIANGVGVPHGKVGHHPFGAPTGMEGSPTGADRLALAALPPQPTSQAIQLAALPHFAVGGGLPPGGTGVVGEDGEELVHANDDGGVTVTPLRGPAEANPEEAIADLPGVGRRGASSLAGMAPAPSKTDLAALGDAMKPARAAAAPAPESYATDPDGAAAARAARQAGGPGAYGVTAPPPGEESAEQDYRRAMKGMQSDTAPDARNPAYKVPMWRKILAIGAGALAGGFAPPRDAEQVGEGAASLVAPNRYARDQAAWQQRQKADQAQLGELGKAASEEEQRNRDADADWRAQQEAAGRQQAADQTAAYRDAQGARQDRADTATQAYRQQQLELERERIANDGTGGAPQLFQDEKTGAWYAWDPKTKTAVPAHGLPTTARRGGTPLPPRETPAQQAAELRAKGAAIRSSRTAKAIGLALSGATNKDQMAIFRSHEKYWGDSGVDLTAVLRAINAEIGGS